MHAPLSTPLPAARGADPRAFQFNEALCREILAGLQAHLPPGVNQVQFGCINGRRAAVYTSHDGYTSRALWLHEDDARDWFVARYYHDMQQLQEIEQEILAEFSAQLLERRFG